MKTDHNSILIGHWLDINRSGTHTIRRGNMRGVESNGSVRVEATSATIIVVGIGPGTHHHPEERHK